MAIPRTASRSWPPTPTFTASFARSCRRPELADQRPGCRPRLVGDGGPRKHSCDLLAALILAQSVDRGRGQPTDVGLPNLPVRMPPRRDLRTMGHDQDLSALGLPLQAR